MTASATQQAPAVPKRGRPRDPNAATAILEATMVELARNGFAGFTIDAVAARAGVSKATIYRRWPGKAALALEAASSTASVADDLPDTGSVRADLISFFERTFKQKGGRQDAVMAGLIAEAVVNQDVRKLLSEYARRRRKASRRMVERAMRRGELAADIDADLLLELVAGPLLYRTLVMGTALDRRHVAKVVDAALRGVGSTPPPS